MAGRFAAPNTSPPKNLICFWNWKRARVWQTKIKYSPKLCESNENPAIRFVRYPHSYSFAILLAPSFGSCLCPRLIDWLNPCGAHFHSKFSRSFHLQTCHNHNGNDGKNYVWLLDSGPFDTRFSQSALLAIFVQRTIPEKKKIIDFLDIGSLLGCGAGMCG